MKRKKEAERRKEIKKKYEQQTQRILWLSRMKLVTNNL